MAGVEAAASLFGSEDSGSDLFATLGATSSPAPPPPPEADLFFNTTSNGPEAGLPDDIFAEQYPNDSSTFLSESQTGAPNGQQADAATEWNHGTDLGTHGEDTPSTYSSGVTAEHTQYSSSPYETYGYNSVGQSQAVNSTSTPSTYGYSAPAPAKSYSSYSAYDPPPPKALPTRSVYDTYTPPAPQSSYQSYEHHTVHAPNGQAYGAYGAPVAASSPYDPPATTHPVTHSLQDSQPYGEPYNQPANNAHSQPQRSPYDPPAHAQRKPFEVPSNSYSGSMYSPPAAVPPPSFGQHSNVLTSPPPPPPPIKSTIVRPKVSNAYDPPLPSISARRPLRASASQQFQAQYQTPMEKYATPPPPPPQMPPPPRSTASYDQYSESFSPPPNVPPNGRRVMTPPHVTHQAESHPPSDYFPPQPATLPVEETVQEPSTHISDDLIPEDSLPDDPEGGIGIPELPQSRPSSTKPLSPPHVLNALSPSLIPLPDSPSPEHHPYAPKKPASPAPKPPASEPDVKKSPPSRYDPYAPKTTHTMLHNHNNYIPRTSSPLSIPNGHTSDIPKPSGPPPRSNLNNSAPIPKPLNPASFHSNYAIEQDVPRTTESKLAPSDALSRHLGAQYAPSPSLIGANDPLSRTSARAPAISFGFGGKLVTCFHGMPGLNAGFDVAFSSRTSSELKIRTLSKVVPELAQGASYPGPLLSDPGTSSISLVRQTATQAKSKKASVLSYLTDRITELEQGVGYLGNAEKQQAEDKIVLIKLLKAMVESDGRLLGTPQAETAVRSALVPRIDVGSTVLQDAVSLQATYTSSSSDGTPIAVTTLRASSLDKIEELLLQGDRRQAYQYAMTEKLWAHAMIIASSIDKDAWKEVAHDFLRTELGTREDLQPNLSKGNGVAVAPQLHTRESLRVAYSLFSGSGGAAVQELVSQSLLQRSLGRIPAPVTLPATTPRTPNFAAVPAANMYPPVPPESLSKWADTAAMIISSPLSTDYAAALTALGDQLLTNNFVEAAHACYLLSPQTSLIGGLGSSTSRLTLVGTKNPGRAAKDKDAIIFSEIFEFAMSLVPTVKGQEPFHGLAQLQTYRFIRAVEIAENGDLQLANRYCDAITACLSHAPNYGNTVLLEQLQGLQQRLSGVFHGDKANSWIGGKISKPSLDSIGGWLEGRFTKLVTGDEDEAAKDSKPTDQPFVGPFAQYSAISSTTPSARSSPQPPSAGIPPPPPQRTASAMAHATPYMPPYQGERSSSAMGYSRQRPPVQIGANGSSAASLASSQSSPTNFGGVNQYNPPSRTASMDEELETPVQASSWWSQSEASNATPTNATFMKVDAGSVSHSDDGFISLMDSNSYSVGPSTPLSSSSRYNHDEDEDDDLGLGNSKPKPPKPEADAAEDSKEPPKQAAPAAAEKPASTPAPAAAAGGSWLKPWTWRKGADAAAAPGPVKASLGDSNAFYYDKEQKRWINKNAAAEPPKPAAPPPPPSRAPSRAQTASPGMSHGPKPPLSAPTPPPPRSVSAMDMSGEPPKAPMRIRSNLAPPTESAPSTPTGSRLTPGAPPPARPRSQAAKRNIRSRYVDVLQQEPSA